MYKHWWDLNLRLSMQDSVHCLSYFGSEREIDLLQKKTMKLFSQIFVYRKYDLTANQMLQEKLSFP